MHPYRERASAERWHTEDIRWRVRVTWGATALLALLVARGLAVLVWPPFRNILYLPPEAAFAQIQSHHLMLFVFALAIAAATFFFTTTRSSDDPMTRRLAWSLRICAIADAGVRLRFWRDPSAWTHLGGSVDWASGLLFAAIPALGMWFVARRLTGLWVSARNARYIALGLAVNHSLIIADVWQSDWITLVLLALGSREVLRLRAAVRVTRHQWWFCDDGQPGWASLLETGLGQCDVILADGEILGFGDRTEAKRWLRRNGHISAKQAARSRRVLDAPPSPLQSDR